MSRAPEYPAAPAPIGPATILTPQQLRCLALVAQGLTSPAIGEQLGLSPRTVDRYVGDACTRLGVRRRVQAVALALERGLISPPARISRRRSRPARRAARRTKA